VGLIPLRGTPSFVLTTCCWHGIRAASRRWRCNTGHCRLSEPMTRIARRTGHAHGEMTRDIAATIPRVVGLNRGQHGKVRLERGHPDTVSKSERGDSRFTLQWQLPVQVSQRG
jgi:hypothetical protein